MINLVLYALAGPSEPEGGGAYFSRSVNPILISGADYVLYDTPRLPAPGSSDPPTALPRNMNFSFENKNPNQKPSIFPALIILPGTHRRYKNEKPSIKWVLFTNASHNTILRFVAIRYMSIQMLKSTQCTEVGFYKLVISTSEQLAQSLIFKLRAASLICHLLRSLWDWKPFQSWVYKIQFIVWFKVRILRCQVLFNIVEKLIQISKHNVVTFWKWIDCFGRLGPRRYQFLLFE